VILLGPLLDEGAVAVFPECYLRLFLGVHHDRAGPGHGLAQGLPGHEEELQPLVVISMLPPYAEKPYVYQDTQDVIINLLMVAVEPYEAFAPILHIATIVIIILIVALEEKMGRVLAAYVGLNYLVIALAPSMGTTEKYGFVIHLFTSLYALVLPGLARRKATVGPVA